MATIASSVSGPPATTSKAPPKDFWRIHWGCTECGAVCYRANPQSRCMCNHRLSEHKPGPNGQHKCGAAKCPCKGGAWTWRCRCKHKNIEHDPVTYKCMKPNCKQCVGFESPFVCNCDHGWKSHRTVIEKAERPAVEDIVDFSQVQTMGDVMRGGINGLENDSARGNLSLKSQEERESVEEPRPILDRSKLSLLKSKHRM